MRTIAGFLLALSLAVVAALPADIRTASALGGVPLHFEPNLGQADSKVLFQARGRRHTTFFTADGIVFATKSKAGRTSHVRMEFVGANPESLPQGIEKLPGHSNYFIGDSSRWRSRTPHYAKLRWEEAYLGIDLVFYGNPRDLEYDLLLAPGASPNTIAMRFQGMDRTEVDADGNLVLHLGDAKIIHRRPRIYQSIDGVERTVAGRYEVHEDGLIGFRLADYDSKAELVIDPVVEFSTLVGADDEDNSVSLFVDAEGNSYVLALTESADFPTTPGGFDTTFNDPADAFKRDFVVFKMDPTGSDLIYSTFIGGSSPEQTHCDGHAIRVDESGNVYVAAETSSSDFPTTAGAFDRVYGGGLDGGRGDAVAFKLSPDGSQLLYSTFLGGFGKEEDACIDIDADGIMYVAGQTASINYPTTAGAFDESANGNDDVFVSVLRPEGTGTADLLYSTYLGGNNVDGDPGIVVGDDGVIHLIVETLSTGYPTTAGAFDETHNGGPSDIAVTTLLPTAKGQSDLIYSTFFGGSSNDKRDGRSTGLAIGPGGDLFITGETTTTQNSATPFPVTPGAFSTEHSATRPGGATNNSDMFVARLRPSGQGADDLVYSTYIGGAREDEDTGIAVDRNGLAYVVGKTTSHDLPSVDPLQQPRVNETTADLYLAVLDPTGSELVFATYLGGTREEKNVDLFITEPPNSSVAASSADDDRVAQKDISEGVAIYVIGETESTNFPTTDGVFGPRHSGARDIFITKIVNDPGSHQVTGVLDAAGGQALISPGSTVSVFGDFAEATATANSIPLSEDLDGFSVTFNDIPGALFGVFDGAFDQSNVQVPWNLDVSSGKVEVKVHWKDETSEVWSDPFEVDAALASPGIYMFPPGTTQAIVTNFKLSEDDGVIAGSWAQPPDSIPNVVSQAAAIGGVATIWANGLGPVTPLPETGDLPQPPGTAPVTDKVVRVFVGGVEAQVLGAVLQSSSVGLNQINIFIPEGVTPGDAAPIVVEVECPDGTKIRSREDVTIAVRAAP